VDGSLIINVDGEININNTDAKRQEANDLNFIYL
jgi:hypothetical protein